MRDRSVRRPPAIFPTLGPRRPRRERCSDSALPSALAGLAPRRPCMRLMHWRGCYDGYCCVRVLGVEDTSSPSRAVPTPAPSEAAVSVPVQVSATTRRTRCAGAAGVARTTSRRASARRAATPPPASGNVSPLMHRCAPSPPLKPAAAVAAAAVSSSGCSGHQCSDWDETGTRQSGGVQPVVK